jgi:hypothetical protein
MALSQPSMRLAEGSAESVRKPVRRRWLRIVKGLLWALLCSALGAALMVLPWGWVWEQNYFVSESPGWAAVWLSPYLRGAITGLGVVNVGISFCELVRLWK